MTTRALVRAAALFLAAAVLVPSIAEAYLVRRERPNAGGGFEEFPVRWRNPDLDQAITVSIAGAATSEEQQKLQQALAAWSDPALTSVRLQLVATGGDIEVRFGQFESVTTVADNPGGFWYDYSNCAGPFLYPYEIDVAIAAGLTGPALLQMLGALVGQALAFEDPMDPAALLSSEFDLSDPPFVDASGNLHLQPYDRGALSGIYPAGGIGQPILSDSVSGPPTAYKGDEVTLTASWCCATEPVAVQWYKAEGDGELTAVPGGTGTTLTFTIQAATRVVASLSNSCSTATPEHSVLLVGQPDAHSAASWDLGAPRTEHTVSANGRSILLVGGRNAGGYLASTETWAAETGRRPGPPLSAPRARHAAIPLKNQNVLILGGRNGSAVLNTAEVYDWPRDRFLKITAGMTTAREAPLTALLDDGRVFIAGGTNATGDLRSAELFDPATETFTAIPNQLAGVHRGGFAIRSSDGTILIGGGPSALLERYSPVTNTFSTLGSLSASRSNATATVLGDGRFFVAGGDAAGTPLSTTELIDTWFMSIAPGPVLASARTEHSAVLLADGNVALFGGRDAGGPLASVEVVDVIGNSSSEIALTGPRRSPVAIVQPTDTVRVTGGTGMGGTVLGTTELFANPLSSTDTVTLPYTGGSATLTYVAGGDLLLCSGNQYAQIIDSGTLAATPRAYPCLSPYGRLEAISAADGKIVFAAVPVPDSWGTIDTFSTTAAHLYDPPTDSAVPLVASGMRGTRELGDGRVLLFTSSGVSSFNPATDSVQPFSAFVAAHGASSVVLPDGTVLLTGGAHETGYLPVWGVSYFEASSEAWILGTSGTTTAVAGFDHRAGHASVVLQNGQVLITGGRDWVGQEDEFSYSVSSLDDASALLYDPVSRIFAPAGRMNFPRSQHRMVLLRDGRVLVLGGGSTAEIYDPETGLFTLLDAVLSTDRFEPAIAELPDSTFLVAGGAFGTIGDRFSIGRFAGDDFTVGDPPAILDVPSRLTLPDLLLHSSRDRTTATIGAAPVGGPLLILQGVDGEPMKVIRPERAGGLHDGAFTAVIDQLPEGLYRLLIESGRRDTVHRIVEVRHVTATVASIDVARRRFSSGQAIEIEAAVSGAPAGASVHLLVDGAYHSSMVLTSGRATFRPSLAPGVRTLRISYPGYAATPPSASPTIQVTVDAGAGASPGVSVSPTALSVAETGTTATFNVVLESEPAGSVVIDVSSSDPGEVTVTPLQLTFTAANWMTPRAITVTGINDALDDGNQVVTVAVTMNAGATTDAAYDSINPPDVTVTNTDDDRAVTTTTVTSSLNPSNVGQTVTFTATVTSATAGAITGTVTFKSGAATLGTGTISAGKATFSTAALAQGAHSITARYEGNASFNPSTSAVLTQSVNTLPATPTSLNAVATSASQVALSWLGASGANSYEVWRTTSAAIPYALVRTSTGTSVTDTGLTSNRTYLYKVRGIKSGGVPTPFSSADIATTVVFTDPSLGTSIVAKAVHLTQLRTAVNAVRTAAGLTAFPFTDSTVTAGVTRLRRIHVVELRTALEAARGELGLPVLSYTDPTITAQSTRIKAAHFRELRQGTQ